MSSSTSSQEKSDKIKAFVKERYTQAINESGGSCCGASGSSMANDPQMIQSIGYTPEELRVIPEDAALNSFGCGNPLAFAEVQPGQVVVDIGSGAGIDCFLAAERVGPNGRVIGIDMTPAMLERARRNARKANLSQVEFRRGDAENLPIDDNNVDWVISNCVINLAPDKKRVFREIARVLKPGGRISVSDIVVGRLPWWVRRSKSFYASCVAGALSEESYLAAIRGAGLGDVRITSRFTYDENAIGGFCCSDAHPSELHASKTNGATKRFNAWLLPKLMCWFAKPMARRLAGKITSIKVVATKSVSA